MSSLAAAREDFTWHKAMLAFCVLFYSTFNTKENFKDNLSRTSQKKYTVANNKLVQSTVQRSIEQNVTMHTY